MENRVDLFKNWREEQDVYAAVPLLSMQRRLKKSTLVRLRKKIVRQMCELQTVAGMFDPTLGRLLHDYSVPSTKKLEDQCKCLYKLLDGDIEHFIAYLQTHAFSSKRLDTVERRMGVNPAVKKFTSLFDVLFDQEDDDEKERFLFTLANKFFEYCFFPETFNQFKSLVKDDETHSIVRLLYAVMWTNLAEVGWQHWHEDAINQLQKDAQSGKEIVYIAGGTDIYQLISHGIYNIRVIDPLLPSQPKYYSQGWDWFITGDNKKGGVGERITMKFGDKKITMELASYRKTGKSFEIMLSTNKKEIISESITKWKLYDAKNKMLGTVSFDRRLTNQKDFLRTGKRTLLVSFNELYFIAAPKKHDGWGINPHKFDESLAFVVKQLAKPVKKESVCNIRYEVKQTDFAFISLGSCVD